MNKNITETQQQYLDNWNNDCIISLYPNGSIEMQSFKNRVEEKFKSEEYDSLMKVLDDYNVPKEDDEKRKYSLVGRFKRYALPHTEILFNN